MAKGDNIDRLFGDLFSDLFSSSWFGEKKLHSMHVMPSITNTGSLRSYSSDNDESSMTLYVDLPGIDPKCVNVKASSANQIIVTSTTAKKTFTNRYTLSEEFDAQTATATWHHGRLDVRVLRAKKAEVTMKRIAVDIK